MPFRPLHAPVNRALRTCFTLGFTLLALVAGAAAQTPAPAPASSAKPRVALVIGNGAYSQSPIDSAVEGARAVAGVLRQGGFSVVYMENARREEIQQALGVFARGLDRGGNGIVFYSGHGLQHQGRNYLVPVDARIAAPDDVRREAIDVDLLLDPLLVARTPGSVIILDASRANPWQPLLPGGLRGLAEPEPAKSISFLCAAAPGRVVTGSAQAGGVFAEQLALAMRTPNIGLDEVASRTRAAVARINGKEQRVWYTEGLTSDVVIISGNQTADAKGADATELGFWDTIKASANPLDYQTYLATWPNGQFVLIARAKLAQLQPKTQPSPASGAGQIVATAPAQDPAARSQVTTAAPPAAPVPAATAAAPAASPSPAAPTATVTAPAQSVASQTLRDCPICPEMVPIPAGSMTMGSTDGFAFETPVREVTIARPFYMGRREITFDEWDACLADGGCGYRPGDRGQGRGLRPASDLDWNDAKAYVAWLSRKTGKTYRLPTEAEWEYAARAGARTAFYWGSAVEKDRANCAGCNASPLNQTVPTGTFAANAFGLLDMAGNAAEWVEDCWEDNYRAAPKDGSAVTKPDCRERVLRGGSFNNDQRFVRTAARFKYDFDVRYYTNGFRVVRER